MLIVSQDVHHHPTPAEIDLAVILSNTFSVNKPHAPPFIHLLRKVTKTEREDVTTMQNFEGRCEKINMKGWIEDGDVSGNWRRRRVGGGEEMSPRTL